MSLKMVPFDRLYDFL